MQIEFFKNRIQASFWMDGWMNGWMDGYESYTNMDK